MGKGLEWSEVSCYRAGVVVVGPHTVRFLGTFMTCSISNAKMPCNPVSKGHHLYNCCYCKLKSQRAQTVVAVPFTSCEPQDSNSPSVAAAAACKPSNANIIAAYSQPGEFESSEKGCATELPTDLSLAQECAQLRCSLVPLSKRFLGHLERKGIWKGLSVDSVETNLPAMEALSHK